MVVSVADENGITKNADAPVTGRLGGCGKHPWGSKESQSQSYYKPIRFGSQPLPGVDRDCGFARARGTPRTPQNRPTVNVSTCWMVRQRQH